MSEPELDDAVRRLATVFARRGSRHALIGGLAVGVRSRPRATKDADFILHVPALAFPGLLEDLVAEGFEIDVLETIRRWSAERFTAFYRGKVRVDWLQPILPLYARVLDAATEQPWTDGCTLRVATAEGLILTKMVAYRLQDRADIETLVIANRATLDAGLIRAEWAPFAGKEPERTAWLETVLAAHVGT